MGKRTDDLAAMMWRKDTGARAWFQSQYVRRYCLTRARQLLFDEFVRPGKMSSRRRAWEDHTKVWYKGRIPMVYTSEPYWLDARSIEGLAAAAREHRLRLTITGMSPHNSGSTILVVLESPDAVAMDAACSAPCSSKHLDQSAVGGLTPPAGLAADAG